MRNLWPLGLVLIGLAVFIIKTTSPTKINVLEHCINHAQITYHIHPRLTIKLNGEVQPMPPDIGITPTCMRPIHTHDDSGKLHLEFTEKYDFRLGDFFLVWGKTFNRGQVGDLVKGQDDELSLTVNGQASSDWENLILTDNQEIVINFEDK